MAAQFISGHSRIVGIFGDPITHTRSPAMHNAAFQSLGLPYVYTPFLVHPADLAKAVQGIRALNLAGVNVTVPHKKRIVRYLDTLSPEAKLCGAVNTIVNRDGKLFGDNTDGRGFLESLKERNISLQNATIILIGAGGSARAILVSLIRTGAKQVIIANRTRAHARTLARTYRSAGKTLLKACSLDTLQDPALFTAVTLVVNCTSVGLHNDIFPPLASAASQPDCVFYDLLYRANQTPFLKQARYARRPILDGRRMLLHQGALAFSLWTGQLAPLRVMERALYRSLR